MNINITPLEDKIKNLHDIISTEIVVPGSPDEELIKEFIKESIREYMDEYNDIKNMSESKIDCLFRIIRKMRIYDGSWDSSLDIP